MDLFTHMMISYLLCTVMGQATGGISEPQLLFGVVAGMFPDFDILTFPLWKRFPRLRHHGISHSLIFPVVNALVMAMVVFLLWGIDPRSLIPIGMMTGVFHVTSDLVTNYEVPLLAPGSWKGYSLYIDSAVNPYLMFPMPIVIAVFWQLRVRGYPYEIFLEFLAGIAIWITLHMSVKLGLKVHLTRKFKHLGKKVVAFPTFWWRSWYILNEQRFGGTNLIEYLDVRIGKDEATTKFYEVEGPPIVIRPPLKDGTSAILYSYKALYDTLMEMSMLTALICEVTEEKDGWTVRWVDFWRRPRYKTKELKVKVQPDGGLDLLGDPGAGPTDDP